MTPVNKYSIQEYKAAERYGQTDERMEDNEYVVGEERRKLFN